MHLWQWLSALGWDVGSESQQGRKWGPSGCPLSRDQAGDRMNVFGPPAMITCSDEGETLQGMETRMRMGMGMGWNRDGNGMG